MTAQTSDEQMRSLGTLKLPEEDAQAFLDAIHAYGYERSAAFLRRCAYAIIKHHQAGESPLHPLSFRLARNVFDIPDSHPPGVEF